jgi:hypothetical protein
MIGGIFAAESAVGSPIGAVQPTNARLGRRSGVFQPTNARLGRRSGQLRIRRPGLRTLSYMLQRKIGSRDGRSGQLRIRRHGLRTLSYMLQSSKGVNGGSVGPVVCRVRRFWARRAPAFAGVKGVEQAEPSPGTRGGVTERSAVSWGGGSRGQRRGRRGATWGRMPAECRVAVDAGPWWERAVARWSVARRPGATSASGGLGSAPPAWHHARRDRLDPGSAPRTDPGAHRAPTRERSGSPRDPQCRSPHRIVHSPPQAPGMLPLISKSDTVIHTHPTAIQQLDKKLRPLSVVVLPPEPPKSGKILS